MSKHFLYYLSIYDPNMTMFIYFSPSIVCLMLCDLLAADLAIYQTHTMFCFGFWNDGYHFYVCFWNGEYGTM